MTFFDVFAWFLLLLASTAVGIFVFLGLWPGKVARTRNHPWAEANFSPCNPEYPCVAKTKALLRTFIFTGLLALAGCGQSQDASSPGGDSAVSDQARMAATVKFTDAQVENNVRRSYQYVAMYNLNNKFPMDPRNPLSPGGWNRIKANTHGDPDKRENTQWFANQQSRNHP